MRLFLYVFQIRNGSDEIVICKDAFCSLHGITANRVRRIASHAATNITSPCDRRGKHELRGNRIPDLVLSQIDEHIRSFPKRKSHYGRVDNQKRYYLSPELNMSRMYLLYLEKFEPDNYLKKKTGETFKPTVKYAFYRNYFNTNYNMSFGQPRTDTCQTCDKLNREISAGLNDAEIKNLKKEKELHIRKADSFYENLRAETVKAKTDKTTETISIDFQQNMPLPHVPAGDVFYKRQLWEYNFCVSAASSGQSKFYMYDEMTGKKGPCEVVSFLHHYIENYVLPEVQTLHLFSDNCGAQNKNHVMVTFLFLLVKSGRFKEIFHHLLPCDRCFGLIEKDKRKRERVHLPSEWETVVSRSCRKFSVVSVKQEMLFDFIALYKGKFKKTITNRHKERYCISKYRLFHYSSDHVKVVRCSVNNGLLVFSDFAIEKPGTSVAADVPMSPLYNGLLKLKCNKVKDVMSLVDKYVPVADLWYYQQMISDEQDQPDSECDADSDVGSDTQD
jgi:hypothetical protein